MCSDFELSGLDLSRVLVKIFVRAEFPSPGCLKPGGRPSWSFSAFMAKSALLPKLLAPRFQCAASVVEPSVARREAPFDLDDFLTAFSMSFKTICRHGLFPCFKEGEAVVLYLTSNGCRCSSECVLGRASRLVSDRSIIGGFFCELSSLVSFLFIVRLTFLVTLAGLLVGSLARIEQIGFARRGRMGKITIFSASHVERRFSMQTRKSLDPVNDLARVPYWAGADPASGVTDDLLFFPREGFVVFLASAPMGTIVSCGPLTLLEIAGVSTFPSYEKVVSLVLSASTGMAGLRVCSTALCAAKVFASLMSGVVPIDTLSLSVQGMK